MIQKFTFGTPFDTEAVVTPFSPASGLPPYGTVTITDAPASDSSDADKAPTFCFTYQMADTDIVYGLGEANRGINKRGYIYTSNCTDDPHHTEEKRSLYGAHNFIIVSGKETFGLFFDYPSIIHIHSLFG